jgi:hypothetical protein
VAAFPALVAGMNRAGIGPLKRDLSGAELRRAALRAFGEVIGRLGVEASHVVFGHTHRAGPLPADDLTEWRAPSGPQIINSGSWVQHHPDLLGGDPGSSPYRPGFCIWLGDAGPPELDNLLSASPGVKHTA